MTITGRLTADAAVNTTKDERKVVNFSVAVNDRYPKGGETVKTTTYFDCSFWRTDKVAGFLKKGTLLELNGRIKPRAYITKDGEAKAGMNCHVNDFKVLAWPKEVEVIGKAAEAGATTTANGNDDTPF